MTGLTESNMPSSWRARVPYVFPSLNVQLRLHWAQRRRRIRGNADVVVMALKIAAPPAIAPRRLRITRIAKRRLDEDNLAGAHKSLVDAIARAGLLWKTDHPRSGNVIEHRQALGRDETVVELEEIGA